MPNVTRQLAAIMFTDIVGYTSLMGTDEHKAMSVLKTNREIHKRIIKNHNGKWLKEMGDGTLASFHAVSDAVYCAGALINSCNEKDIDLRIGIHSGDVIEEDGDIFGDGVNVASRLEPLAAPNQIMVSDPIHINIKNKSGITSTFVEEKQLKNVDEPVRIYSVEVEENSDTNQYNKPPAISKSSKPFLTKPMLIGMITVLVITLGITYFFNPLGESESTINSVKNIDVQKSIAVLPFKDMSSEQDQEYLGDGIAEEIINRLTRIEDLKVIGRTSSFSFKDKDTDLKTIGEMLDVKTILEGSVQKSGNQLRITAQLINAEDGSHFWSERFDREFSDVFAIQDELASLVLTIIKSNAPSEKEMISSSKEYMDPEAYEFYLKGSYLLERSIGDKDQVLWNSEEVERMFLNALKLKENYPLAHAGLARLYNRYNYLKYYLQLDSLEVIKYKKLQIKHIKKAYEFGADLDYVNLSMGFVQLEQGEVDSAYQSFVNAIVLNPNDDRNYIGLGYFLNVHGLYNESSILYEKATAINPLDLTVLAASLLANNALRNCEKIYQISKNMLLADSSAYAAYKYAFRCLIHEDNIDSAEVILQIIKSFSPDGTDHSINSGLIYASRKDTAKALAIRDDYSWYYAKLGMKEKYIKTFLIEYNRTNKYGSGWRNSYISLINRTSYDWVKDDPRIQEIVQNEKHQYDSLHAKYGNLDFLDL